MTESKELDLTFLGAITLAICLTVGAVAIGALNFSQPNQPALTITEDYIGKVIQVDHITTTTSGLFSSSSRTDTYVTFNNSQTYWKPGYQVIIEGQTYNVHTIKTVKYGLQAMGNGTLTTVENTFTVVP